MIAYFDCFSGISGNMTLGAFIDLGVPVSWLREQIAGLPLEGFDISVAETSRNGIGAKIVDVPSKNDGKSRHYSDIKRLLENSELNSRVKMMSLDAFDKLAEAESTIHQSPKESVHFHEVGGIDAIVDIVGSALCIDYLGIDRVISSHLPLGGGFVECSHGVIPVPAPATLAILKDIPVYGCDIPNELVTPTGAAIIATFADVFGQLPEMKTEKVGYGAGSRSHAERPNLLRIILGHPLQGAEYLRDDTVVVIETAIDDMNPEIYGYVMERLFEDGALDVHWIPIHMKKNRPGTMIRIICPQLHTQAIIQRLLAETSSLGVRYYEVKRKTLHREKTKVETPWGVVEAKRVTLPDGTHRITPEFEVSRNIAQEYNIPLHRVYEAVSTASVIRDRHKEK